MSLAIDLILLGFPSSGLDVEIFFVHTLFSCAVFPKTKAPAVLHFYNADTGYQSFCH